MRSEQKAEQQAPDLRPPLQAPDLKGVAIPVHRAGSLGTAPPSLITNSPHHPASASGRFGEMSVWLPQGQQAS